MSDATPLRVDVPFDETEKLDFKKFLKSTGRKAGPWVRAVMLQAIAAETSRGVGSLLPQHQDAHQ